MSALSTFVDETLADLSNFGVLQGRTAWLVNSVTAADKSWKLEASDSVSQGVAEIGDEQVYFKSYDSASTTATVSADGRGWQGTTPASHDAGTRINLEPRFPRKSVEAAINRAIVRSFPTIWGVAVENLTVVGGVATYELPATTLGVNAVLVETLGPSKEWVPVRDFVFDGHADTTAFPSGKSITIPGGVFPGRTVQVIVRTQPVSLTSAMGSFSDTGLQDSAKAAIRMGALADLIRTCDPMWLTVNSTAAADEYDTKRPYGTATKIANDLEGQFQLELRAELGRLRSLYPATIRRKRY